MKNPAVNTEISIGGRKVGPAHPPFIIAEMSGNHNGSLEKALEIVEAAAETGADALKLQTYTADTMTIDLGEGEFFIADPDSLWKGASLYELYQKAHTPWEWHAPIMQRCRELGLLCFSSPFDATAVDFLESLDVPAYKIASFEIVDLPLIRKVAATGKPMIISTGMSAVTEIEEAVNAAREAGCRELILLKCTSSYPADPRFSNLKALSALRGHFQDRESECFNLQVGLSDHTLGIGAAVAGVALGATVIEKHFVLDRAEGGVDAAFSLEPAEMKQLVRESRTAHQALGDSTLGPTDGERSMLRFRRSLYFVQDLAPGEVLTPENMRAIRPGLGLPPKYYEALLGKRVSAPVKRGTPVRWELVE